MPGESRRLLQALVASSVLIAVAHRPVQAQEISGRVLEGDTGRPIVGAVVTLLNADSVAIASTLTSVEGGFSFSMLRDVPYWLSAEMIGRQRVVQGPLTEAPRDYVLRLPSSPIQLDGLQVTGESRCSIDPSSAAEIYTVWQDVSTALRATALTRASARYRFRIAEYERGRDRGTMQSIDETVRHQDVAGVAEPFGSLSAVEVHESGYVRDINGYFWVYGPSIEVLLSPAFQSAHCFALVRNSDHPGAIGLKFEPVDGRTVPEIRGVLWVNETSSALEELDFELTNRPPGLMRGDYTGFAEFGRMEDGGWIIMKWWLRAPDPTNLSRLNERGGQVIAVERTNSHGAFSGLNAPS